MTTINTSSLSGYGASLSLTVKNPAAEEQAAATGVSTEKSDVKVSLGGAQAGGAKADGAAGGGSATSSAVEETIANIKEQIEAAKKQLAQQQAQLSAAQNGSGSDEEKAQKALAIQTQIASTNALLQTLQATLITLTTQGGVKTTA